MKTLSALAWVLYGIGISLILTLQIVAITIVYNYWGWNKSYFAQHYFRPLLALAFLFCLGAPFVAPRPLSQRWRYSLAAVLSAALFYWVSSFIILLLYGA